MTQLKDKVANALNETRTLILGAEILLGFQFEAAFQPGFERLSAHHRMLDLAGLVLMMAAVALLVAPCPFHRLHEDGRDTLSVHAFTTRMAESALVPFALCIGVDVFIVAERLLGIVASLGMALLFAGRAAFFWYALAAARRNSGETAMAQADEMPTQTSLGEKIKTLMTEIRVILPGVQALLGFQFAAFLSDGFDKLAPSTKLVHLAGLAAVALATILLMAPAAYHRIAADGEDRADVDRVGGRLMLAALVPLALGLCGEFYVVAGRVGYARGAALAAAILAFGMFMGLWFFYPLVRRDRRRDAPSDRGRTGNDARPGQQF